MIAKNQSENRSPDFETGEIILIDKREGLSSFQIIHKVRKVIQVKKVGHAGTLDPLASGLLIVCTGKRTKEITLYQDMIKTYSGIITLGKTTPTMDAESEVSEEKSISGITEKDVIETGKLFLGNILQTPPMYSAVKYKGKSLYKYARQGREVERQPRQITIYRFDITKINLPEVHFEVDCSKGTYIRVLAYDFGAKLGCGGYLTKLRRDRIGEYNVKDAYSIREFEELFDTLKIKSVG